MEHRGGKSISNSNAPNYWTTNKGLISMNCFHIAAIFTSFLLIFWRVSGFFPSVHRLLFPSLKVMMAMLHFILELLCSLKLEQNILFLCTIDMCACLKKEKQVASC